HSALSFVDGTIQANQRADGLYHAYNLVEFDKPGGIPVSPLHAMLEGQVAVLGANILSGEESLRVLKALRHSEMYRANQHTYTLYPDRQLPRFVEKNNIPSAAITRSKLFKRLLADGNTQLVERDVAGVCHFNPRIMNAGDVQTILSRLSAAGYGYLVKHESA